jgi:hypothetical protein
MLVEAGCSDSVIAEAAEGDLSQRDLLHFLECRSMWSHAECLFCVELTSPPPPHRGGIVWSAALYERLGDMAVEDQKYQDRPLGSGAGSEAIRHKWGEAKEPLMRF